MSWLRFLWECLEQSWTIPYPIGIRAGGFAWDASKKKDAFPLMQTTFRFLYNFVRSSTTFDVFDVFTVM